jgi:hypothetical protein
MAELIEILNNTSPARTVFYCVVAIIIIGILGDAIGEIAKAIFKRRG